MVDFNRYLKSFEKARLSEMVCRRCWAHSKSASGIDAFCNFCEQYIGTSGYGSLHNPEAEAVFLRLQGAANRGLKPGDFAALDALLKSNSDPRVLYVAGVFYALLSDSLYRSRDYRIPGFMEENSSNIRASLDCSARSKALFYGAIALAGREPFPSDDSVELLFMEFLCWIRLKRIADASRALMQLHKLLKGGRTLDYADMVFSVESGAADADVRLGRLLSINEPNALYYLAKRLAKGKRIGEAQAVLGRLGRKANVPIAQQLMNAVKEAQDASRI
jgi:hypothetical protein